MDYREAVSWILGLTDYERIHSALYSEADFDLRRMDELMARLGNPHIGSRSVHIAGSKGKGSTAAMIASSLSAGGYPVGLFTSPHLHTLRERISVNKQLISEAELVYLVDRLVPELEAVNAIARYGRLTTFEVLAALAFLYFREKKVDFQVVETGLGGRLDATNVLAAEVCVITSISLDHVGILGDTIPKIAAEKAGIIKSGATVVSSPQWPKAMRIIEDVCKERGADLIEIGRDVTWQKLGHDLDGQYFSVTSRLGTYDLAIPLLGEHQLENAATAVAVLELLDISERFIVEGFREVTWPGRMEVLGREPIMVADGAHNVDSATKLIQSLKQYFNYNHLIMIVGMSADKDIDGIIDALAPACDEVIVTRSRHPRHAELSDLANGFTRHGLAAKQCTDAAEAVARALKIAKKDDLICATGSLFIVAEVIEQMKGLSGEVYSL
jgi:dihydrofolate synthase/folylpolyglutamate synthase